MDALIKWAIIAGVGVVLATLVYVGWQASVAEPYREEGRAELRPKLNELRKDYDETSRLLARQGKLLDDLAIASKTRVAQADAARAAAQKRADAAETRALTILATKPTVPNDPCASACRLLSDPL